MKAYEFEFPEDRYYLKNHIWLKENQNDVLVGITELGQSLSKGIVHIDLPEKGEFIKKGDTLVAYETIKAVSHISIPFDAHIVQVNENLWDKPEIINSDPYNEWIVKISCDFDNNLLMDVKSAVNYYKKLISEERERYL